MSLSKEQKEALNAHYHGKDLYSPADEPEQDPPTFMPDKMTHEKGFCDGGPAGYSRGGPVKMNDGGDVPQLGALDSTDPYAMDPDPNAKTDELAESPSMLLRGISSLANMTGKPAEAAQVQPQTTPKPPTMPQAAPSAPQAPIDPEQEANVAKALMGSNAAQAPAAPSSQLQPDQMQDLIQALTQRPGIGQSAMSGLAGLADAIETGVARGANPGFQKNITEQQQVQKQNLIAALEAKYKGKQFGLDQLRLGQEGDRIANEAAHNTATEKQAKDSMNAENDRARMEAGVRANEAGASRAQSGLEAAARLPATGLLHPSTWGRGSEIEAQRAKLASAGMGSGASSGPVQIKSHADYMRLPAGTHYVDKNGKEGVKK